MSFFSYFIVTLAIAIGTKYRSCKTFRF